MSRFSQLYQQSNDLRDAVSAVALDIKKTSGII